MNSGFFLQICCSSCPPTFINGTPTHLAAYAGNLRVILDTSYLLMTPSNKTLKSCHLSRAHLTSLIFSTDTIFILVQATSASCRDDGHTSDLTTPLPPLLCFCPSILQPGARVILKKKKTSSCHAYPYSHRVTAYTHGLPYTPRIKLKFL